MALYVHLAWDGGILVSRGDTGTPLWTDHDGLDRELRAAKERDDLLFYSRERAEEDPPVRVTETFRRIAEFDLPMKLLEEPPFTGH